MKSKSLFIAMAALAIAGCSQNEVTEISRDVQRPIGLDVYTGVQTKGKETTTTTIKGSGVGFGILAYKTSTNGWSTDGATTAPSFMYNEHGTWSTSGSSGSWGYTNIRFWPTNGDKISFFAYAPYEAAPSAGTNQKITLSKLTDNGAPKITFEVKTTNNWKDMVDLVTDARSEIKDKTSADNSGTVSFKFSHVLTKIANVKVKPDMNLGSDTKIFVTGLKLNPGTNKLFNKAIYDLGTGNWGAISPTASYFSGDQDLSGFLDKKTPSQWGYNTSSIDVSSTTAKALFPTGEALYFIPVANGTGTAAAGDLKLKISYDIVTKVDNSNHIKSTVTDKEISLPQYTFKKGIAHTYTLTINMNAIKITVDDAMEAWGTGSDSGLTVQ